ncbi:MAG: DNA replication/repair protein RecF [Bacteroides sp.]|jgi:DNA replication and repair protein RecF|nr:DNA replication/repair protein RecF [Bacteroides sp.]
MYLQKLTLINFRNYAEIALKFSSKFNCFAGNNGTGKTNLLEAIYYLSFCKSFSNPIDTQNILFEQDFFMMQGHYQMDGTEDELYCGVKRQQRKVFKRNKKEYDRLSDHIGLYPLVLISPGDAQLILGGSEERRKFVDGVISQYQHEYLHHLISYNKALSQRNALLKMFAERRTFDPASLEIWDEQLVLHGEMIFEERKKFFDAFLPVFNQYYSALSGGNESVNIDYQSTLLEGDFQGQLIKAREKDRVIQYTSVGIHKDELLFFIHDVPVKRYGSQGQQKSFLIALKLAQFSFTREVKGFSPILLFDDIFDKLDEERVEQLMRLVSDDSFGQVFVTDTHLERLESLFRKIGGESRIFFIESGNITKVSHPNHKQ